ncbi:hypothetical protein M099_4192 [Phocaeicola vulgatus str. 3975 RP4]|uniref:Uncharacterized protein n=1 Tax=Phocaeicola vulgatus str. 3975 RP4 TaxID=1339352 RepID=A0A069S3E8_PHOVU|nr:hypothetical protein M099_4192 [Phocaeicola vulgatus str. 3975 RP4]
MYNLNYRHYFTCISSNVPTSSRSGKSASFSCRIGDDDGETDIEQ